MAIPNGITVETAKMYLKIPASNTQHDEFLDILIGSTTEWIADCLNLPSGLTQNTYSDVLDVEDYYEASLRLPRYPVQSITALTNGDASTAVADTYLKADRWLLLKDEYFSQGRQEVEVTYVAGWETVPAYVEQAIALSVAKVYNTAPNTGLASERMGAYAIALAGAGSGSGGGGVSPIAPESMALLNMHLPWIVQR